MSDTVMVDAGSFLWGEDMENKKKWTLKGKFVMWPIFRRTHTLLFKRNKTLLIMIFDDRVTYTYIKSVPTYTEIDGAICRAKSESVRVYDKRTIPSGDNRD